MGKSKKNRNNDITLTKLLIVKAILEVLTVVVTLILKLIDQLST